MADGKASILRPLEELGEGRAAGLTAMSQPCTFKTQLDQVLPPPLQESTRCVAPGPQDRAQVGLWPLPPPVKPGRGETPGLPPCPTRAWDEAVTRFPGKESQAYLTRQKKDFSSMHS